MEQPKQTCIQCRTEKEFSEFFVYKKSGKSYRWCKDCVRQSAEISHENHVARSQQCRLRWGTHAI